MWRINDGLIVFAAILIGFNIASNAWINNDNLKITFISVVLNQQKLLKGHIWNTEMQNTADLFRGFGLKLILLLFFL